MSRPFERNSSHGPSTMEMQWESRSDGEAIAEIRLTASLTALHSASNKQAVGAWTIRQHRALTPTTRLRWILEGTD
jgi:hypothetical protein